MTRREYVMIRDFFGHLKTVLIHKFWVFYYACKLGIVWQGIVHDLSKFSPVEFFESVKFYQGGKKSPIPVVKKELGYSKAWQHHKGRNPHHYEYWTDNYDSGTTAIKIPYKYVLEMVADWLGAGKAYNGKGFSIEQEIEWWNKCRDSKFINDETKKLISYIFETIDEDGFKAFRKMSNDLRIIYEVNQISYLM